MHAMADYSYFVQCYQTDEQATDRTEPTGKVGSGFKMYVKVYVIVILFMFSYLVSQQQPIIISFTYLKR